MKTDYFPVCLKIGQTHKMVKVGRDLWVRLAQPLFKQGHRGGCLGPPCPGGSWRFSRRKSHSLSGQPVLLLDCCVPLCANCLLSFILSHSPFRCLWTLMRSPELFLFQTELSGSPSLSSQERYSSHFIISVPLWGLSPMCPCLSYWGAQNWIRYFRPGLTSTEKSGRISAITESAGGTLTNTTQDTISLLCCKDTELAHVQLGVCQDSQVSFSTRLPSSWVAYNCGLNIQSVR